MNITRYKILAVAIALGVLVLLIIWLYLAAQPPEIEWRIPKPF